MTPRDHLSLLVEALEDFDPAKPPHGLEKYPRFGPRTVRAILEVRDLVMHTSHLEESKFRIGLTADLAAREAEERRSGCVEFKVVSESTDPNEARTIEADVRLNFLWHFPGRCLNKGEYRQDIFQAGDRLFVYVSCFPASAYPILGKV